MTHTNPNTGGDTLITLANGVVGTLCLPAADAPAPAVLMLHGFASSRSEAGNLYTRLAAALAKRGIASLRIDFRGWGDSGGAMTDSSVIGMVEDADAAVSWLAALDAIDSRRIGILGFSMGGSIAVFSAGQHPPRFKSMTLWSTFGSLRDAFLSSLGQARFDAAAHGAVDIDLGWRRVTLGGGFFTSLDAYDYRAAFARYGGALMVIAGTQDGSAQFIDWYRENARGALKASYLIEGGDHTFQALTDDQTRANAVIDATAAWFDLSL